MSFKGTNLWLASLAPQPENDPASEARERLRTSFLSFRERASILAAEIVPDQPGLTVHDITHSDALWEMAELVAGEEIRLTPTEAFVLGGAFLIHDLGMGIIAFPGGQEALRADPRWRDIVALRSQTSRLLASVGERRNADEDVEQDATTEFLRSRHAEIAERLATTPWSSSGGDRYLLEDFELREDLGPACGEIAHSHWWGIEEVWQKFGGGVRGAPASIGAPGEWTLNRLKLACLLRAADAAHVDSRRAPSFLRTLRNPSGDAGLHWDFQAKITQPTLEGDRLRYTSKSKFGIKEAGAWWIGYELLQVCDRTLREVDTLLQDTQSRRFRARGVVGVEEPKRLMEHIETQDWLPIDTKVKVSNVAALVRSLGGRQLYGDDQTAPLRELIQNASDAVRARRLIEGRPDDWGDVTVRLGEDEDGHWIEVEDNGVGMSTAVLSGPLLDFGEPFWNTPMMLEEFPGLQDRRFRSTGRYGIGFFSIFIWGEHVRITTRRYRDAFVDTRVLEFGGGPAARPLLRKAQPDELRIDGGTCIRVWLNRDALRANLYRLPKYRLLPDTPAALVDLCSSLCSTLDANLWVEFDEGHREPVIVASDWITMDGESFLRRVWSREELFVSSRRVNVHEMAYSFGPNLRLLKGPSDDVVGRACVTVQRRLHSPSNIEFSSEELRQGVVATGGFYVRPILYPAGVFTSIPTRAARDEATPLVSRDELARWASEQADLLAATNYEQEALMQCARVVRACGGDTGSLPVAEGARGWLTASAIANWREAPEEIFLANPKDIEFRRQSGEVITLRPDVLAVWQTGISGSSEDVGINDYVSDTQLNLLASASELDPTLLSSLVIEALATAWSCSRADIITVSHFLSEGNGVERIVGTSQNDPQWREFGSLVRKPQ